MRLPDSSSLHDVVRQRLHHQLLSAPRRSMHYATVVQTPRAGTPSAARLSPCHALEPFVWQSLDTWPAAQANSRGRIPKVAQQFFPIADNGSPTFYATVALQFALQWTAAQESNPLLRQTLLEFAGTLQDSARFLIETYRHAHDPASVRAHLAGLARAYVRPLLHAKSAIIFPGGYENKQEGHAACLLFLPRRDGQTLCAVIDRVRDVVRYPRDDRRRPAAYRGAAADCQPRGRARCSGPAAALDAAIHRARSAHDE